MEIPYIDLPAQHRALKHSILEAVARVLDHGQFILGPEVASFEQRLAGFVGARHVVGVSSGTDALVLALRLRGVGPGDEVITVSHSFVATASAIALTGARPVFVDVDPDTLLMDPDLLPGVLTDRTKAVLPVHLNGFACPVEPLAAFCESHGLALIEDCAQALGARAAGRSVGTFGVGCLSLHPLKALSACGDAGAIFVDSDEDAARLRELRNLGLVDRDTCGAISGNCRLDALQAAILRVKLDHLGSWLEARRTHAEAYRARLAGVVALQAIVPGTEPSHSAVVISHPRRDELLAGLHARGVDAKVHYPVAIHQQPAFADLTRGPLPVTERIVNQILSLPASPEVSPEQREAIINAVIDLA